MDLSKDVMAILGEGFDPEKSPVTSYDDLVDGVYDVVIEKVEHKESQNTGSQWFQITLQVTTGDHQGRKFFGKLFLTEKTKVVSLKTLMKYAYTIANLDLQPSDFTSIENVINMLNNSETGLVGITCTLTLKTSKDFQNWTLTV